MAVIDSLKSVVSSSVWTAVQEQINRMTLIQRLTRDKEINLFIEDTTPLARWSLPSPYSAWPLAVVRCRVRHRSTAVRASVWIARGNIASIVFSDSPIDAGVDEFLGMSAEVLGEPFAFEDCDCGQSGTIASLFAHASPEIQELARCAEWNVRAPLNPFHKASFLVPAFDCLPLDCVELLDYTNGFRCNGWNFAGLPFNEVAMEEANLFVLANSDAPYALCAKDGDADRNVYLFDLEDHVERRIGDSFLWALESAQINGANKRKGASDGPNC